MHSESAGEKGRDGGPVVSIRGDDCPGTLTVHSVESNLRVDGTEKININQSLLTELYDALASEFDEEIATSYELGWKTTLYNQRLTFNGTLFLVDYEDFQAESFDGADERSKKMIADADKSFEWIVDQIFVL